MERLGRLKRFFSAQVAELILTGEAEDPLKTHRREVTVVFIDLRGFTAFAETAEPEEVMAVLREYHAAVGEIIIEHEGTVERFAGDAIMIFFNDPVVVPNPAERALRMAVAVRDRTQDLSALWRRRGTRHRRGARHRPGLRDHRRHRVRGAMGLRRDRDGDEPRRPPVRGGQGRPDPRVDARGRRGRWTSSRPCPSSR